MNNMPSEPSFLCTFCWQLQYPPNTSKIIGAESRICCHDCWEQILDLSICWVCGEIIVRGDEVVSLGWCFWHAGCFGCLICGKRLRLEDWAPRVDADNKQNEDAAQHATVHVDCGHLKRALSGNRFLDDISQINRNRSKRPTAIELDVIPACKNCDEMLADTGAYRPEVEGFLGKSNVSRNDGGLAEARWERLRVARDIDGSAEHEGTIRRKPRSKRRKGGRTSRGNRDYGARPHSPLGIFSTLGQDGSEDAPSQHPSRGASDILEPVMPRPPPPAQFYVSILDPINEPSFRPSKMKPIPRWMSLLPGNIERGRTVPLASPTLQVPTPAVSRNVGVKPSEQVDDYPLPPLPPAPTPSPSHDSGFITASSDTDFVPLLQSSNTLPTIPESSARPIPRSQVSHRSDSTTISTYGTPPEYPTLFFSTSKTSGPESISRPRGGEVSKAISRLSQTSVRDIDECVEAQGKAPFVRTLLARYPSGGGRIEEKSLESGGYMQPTGRMSGEYVERYGVKGKEPTVAYVPPRHLGGILDRVKSQRDRPIEEILQAVGESRKMEDHEASAAAGSAKSMKDEQESDTDINEEEKKKRKLRSELKGLFGR